MRGIEHSYGCADPLGDRNAVGERVDGSQQRGEHKNGDR